MISVEDAGQETWPSYNNLERRSRQVRHVGNLGKNANYFDERVLHKQVLSGGGGHFSDVLFCRLGFADTGERHKQNPIRSTAHLHILLERFGSCRERQFPLPPSKARTVGGRVSLTSPHNTSVDSCAQSIPFSRLKQPVRTGWWREQAVNR